MLRLNGQYTVRVWENKRNVETFDIKIVDIKRGPQCNVPSYTIDFGHDKFYPDENHAYVYPIEEVSFLLNTGKWTIREINILDDELFVLC